MSVVPAHASECSFTPLEAGAFEFKDKKYRLHSLYLKDKENISSYYEYIRKTICNPKSSLQERAQNRYGETSIIILDATQTPYQSAQEYLVEQGLALFFYESQESDLVPFYASLRAAENRAREAKAGLWLNPDFFIEPKHSNLENPLIRPYDFQIIEGIIHSISPARRVTYINFHENWRRDFTIMIDNKDYPRFATELDLKEGDTIRVRGWPESYYGPMMKLTHPMEIEIMDRKQ